MKAHYEIVPKMFNPTKKKVKIHFEGYRFGLKEIVPYYLVNFTYKLTLYIWDIVFKLTSTSQMKYKYVSGIMLEYKCLWIFSF